MTPVIAAHRARWLESDGDPEEAIAAAERRLGLQLPAILREFYANTSLRHSQMLHLCTLDTLEIRKDVLAFMREQQGCWRWGIPLARLHDADPMVVSDPRGAWTDDGCALSQLLEFFSLTNRPYESPCKELDTNVSSPPSGWQAHRIAWRTIQHELWSCNDAVYEPVTCRLGAKDAGALSRARSSLR